MHGIFHIDRIQYIDAVALFFKKISSFVEQGSFIVCAVKTKKV